MSNETTLLPCPFCGGKATVTEFNHGCIISCENDAKAWINGKDNVDGHLAHIQSRSKAEAIAAWNTRAAKPCYATDYTHDHCKYSVNRGWVEDTRFFIPTAELGGGTLTAEQAIAATLGSGTCEWLPVESCHTFAGPGWECSNCGHEVGEYEHDFYNCCPICCAKVVKR